MNEADAALLNRARQGDRAALEELLAKYEDRVFRFGMRMCRDRDDAKDVLQDTLLALTKGVGDFRGASSLSTWLFTVARSYCIKKRRRQKHAPAEIASLSLDTEQVASNEPLPDVRAEQLELHAALGDAIRALEPKYREVLLLRDVEGLSAAEVAEVLGLSVEATKSRLHRARTQVRATLAPRLSPSRDAQPAAASDGACPDVVTLLSKKLEDDIDVGTCAEMERHVERCPRCKEACDSLKRTLALCQTAPAGRVPPDVQAAVREAMRSVLAVST